MIMKYVPLYLSAVLLLCLAPMPYGYYTLVRILATVVFGLYAYKCYQAKKEGMTWGFVTLVLLFQPFAKVGLGRTLWNVIDVIVAIGLIALFFWEWNERKKIEKGNSPINPNGPIKIENVKDNKIEFKLEGKLAPKELIYVASEEDKELADLFESKPEVFNGWGQMMGFHIVYLPLLMKRLANKEVLRYRAPYLSETEITSTTIGNDFLLQYLEHPGERGRIKHGFIRTEDIRTEDLIEEVKERIAKLRQRGISQYILEQLIHPDDRLSRMVITNDYRIVLPEYNNLEIKMEPIVKAVYLLFLNHPEGILFKNLPDYREELTKIYMRLKPSGLSERALQSIEDVTNPLLNSINEKCARIRGAFVGQFDDHMAKHYYIDGLRGKVKKISLSRELVVWNP